MNKVRWGILSTSKFAQAKVIPALLKCERVEVAAIASRDQARAYEVAGRFGIPKAYGSYEELLADPEIEVIYNPAPNHLHVPWSTKALEAGKHVLCEKPMAISSAECRKMIDACRQAKVKLMIGYRVHYEPMWNQAIGIIQTGQLGQLQSFHGGFFGQQRAGAWRLTKALGGGGALLDLGIYPLNAIRHITGEEPTNFSAVIATRERSGRFSEVEQSMEWTMKLPSGIIASCGCSYGQSGPSILTINGESGYLVMEPAFNYEGVRLHGNVGGKPIELASTEKHPYQFTIEAEHFADCIRNNKEPEAPGEEGLKDMLAIEAIYQAAGAPIA